MTPPRGPFAVVIHRRPDGWYRVTGLYQSRPPRVGTARSCGGHCKWRDDAVASLRSMMR